MSNDYTYENAGYDSFLSRSVDDNPQVNLDSQGPTSTAFRYDSGQSSGSVGDKISIGSVVIDGTKGRISIYDGGVEIVRLGSLD